MSTTVTSSRATTKPPVALCLACNYSLHALADSRCPECGRPFDLADGATFNSSRPFHWFDRQLLAPIGAVTFGLVLLPCAWLLYLSLGTDIYYMGIPVVMMVLL